MASIGDIKSYSKYVLCTKRMWRESFKNITQEEYMTKLENEVFSDADFIRQVEEVSIKTNIPHEVVESVIKHYISHVFGLLTQIQKKRLRIIIYGYFVIETTNSYFDKRSKYYYKNAVKINRKLKLNKVLKEFKNVTR